MPPTATPEPTQPPATKEAPAAEKAIYQKSPWWPWLTAHIKNKTPPDTLTGPVILHGEQPENGPANFLLPGPRKLDPTIFGTADNPKGTDLPAIVLGVPEEMRAVAKDGTLMTKGPTPFGDKVVTVQGGVTMTLVDATAMDGATTKDQIDFVATFGSPNGKDVYKVVVKKAAPHGMFIPTGGGVVTNFIQHGVTGWGTRLMPTLYSYVSFWGMGDIYKNGELIAQNRVVHGMLTEFVRKAPYDLAFDNEVNPNAVHFHLMIPPVDPFGNPSPIPTGFTLPNGKELPFFHVMFPNVKATAHPLGASKAGGETSSATQPTQTPAGVSGGQVREIHVTAQSFSFTPNEITIKKGETVRFIVESKDIFHTFTVKRHKEDKDYLFSLELFPDKGPQTYEFTPSEVGDYYLYCIPHENLGMTGVIHVVG